MAQMAQMALSRLIPCGDSSCREPSQREEETFKAQQHARCTDCSTSIDNRCFHLRLVSIESLDGEQRRDLALTFSVQRTLTPTMQQPLLVRLFGNTALHQVTSLAATLQT